MLQSTAISEIKKQLENYPDFANPDEADAADGQSTAVSGAGTPSGQPKLKLTFNTGNRDSANETNSGAVSDEE